MRTLYLIRHGQPLVSEEHTCGYAQDVPLSEPGRRQAEALRDWALDKPIRAVFSSPARRCVQTAQILAGDRLPVYADCGLTEVDTGVWTGLPFEEIKTRWPEEYARRGQHIGTCPPPGGESFAQAGERMDRTVSRLLARTEGDLVLVAHGGINRGWLCRLLGHPADQVMALPQPWGGLSELALDRDRVTVRSTGVRPNLWPDWEEVQALWAKYGTPVPVRDHCQAVARRAMELADQTGRPLNRDLLRAACLLHDLVRDRPDHARAGGERMVREGYPLLGQLIALHHDLPQGAGPEASLLYLADKLVQGSRPVSLEERFRAKRPSSPEAAAAWERRFRRALLAAEELELDLT